MRYALLASSLLVGLGTQLSGLEDFRDAATPSYIGGTLITIGTVVSAVFVKPPGGPS